MDDLPQMIKIQDDDDAMNQKKYEEKKDQYDNYNQNQQQSSSEQKPAKTGWFSYCTFEQSFNKVLNLPFYRYYQPLFDVTTDEVKNRIVQAFKPFSNQFFEIAKNNPDLYGPFWIYTTLIFLVAASGNVFKEAYEYKFIPVAASLIYGFGFIVPLILALIMKYFGSVVGIIQTICIYGYSLSCFIPISILCVIPSKGIRWVFLFYGLLNSACFLICNFWHELGNYIEKKKYIVIGFIAGCQIIMFLIFEFYFFGEVYDRSTDNQIDIPSKEIDSNSTGNGLLFF